MNASANHVRALSLLTVALLFASCSNEGTQTIVARVPSPDGVAEAYVVRYSGPATVPFSDVVYVVARGAPLPSPDRANFVAKSAKGLSVGWSGQRVLDISYDSARVTHFSNFDDHLRGGSYVVELRLRPEGEHSF